MYLGVGADGLNHATPKGRPIESATKEGKGSLPTSVQSRHAGVKENKERNSLLGAVHHL